MKKSTKRGILKSIFAIALVVAIVSFIAGIILFFSEPIAVGFSMFSAIFFVKALIGLILFIFSYKSLNFAVEIADLI